jgi:hypothetical protein
MGHHRYLFKSRIYGCSRAFYQQDILIGRKRLDRMRLYADFPGAAQSLDFDDKFDLFYEEIQTGI